LKPQRLQSFYTEIHGVILCGLCVFLLCVLRGLISCSIDVKGAASDTREDDSSN